MNLIVATSNEGKVKEFRSMLSKKFDKILSLKDIQFDTEIIEDGETFLENAIIKARFVKNNYKTDCAILADDSGLCVDILNGQPGIYSARFSGGNDKDNRNKLLNLLKDKTNRKASFISAVALILPNNDCETAVGATEGEILYGELGNGGFGYDCIFYSHELEMSFGLATEGEKNKISHRGKAIELLLKKI